MVSEETSTGLYRYNENIDKLEMMHLEVDRRIEGVRPLEALKERIADERKRGHDPSRPLDALRERNKQLKVKARRNAILRRMRIR